MKNRIGRVRPSRPWPVTLLALGLFLLALISSVRLVQAVEQWAFLHALLPISPLYIALSGLFWALAAFLVGWGLWWGLPWAPSTGRLVMIAFVIYLWVDRLWVAQAPTRLANVPFAAAASLLVLGFTFWSLPVGKPRPFFGKSIEHL